MNDFSVHPRVKPLPYRGSPATRTAWPSLVRWMGWLTCWLGGWGVPPALAEPPSTSPWEIQSLLVEPKGMDAPPFVGLRRVEMRGLRLDLRAPATQPGKNASTPWSPPLRPPTPPLSLERFSCLACRLLWMGEGGFVKVTGDLFLHTTGATMDGNDGVELNTLLDVEFSPGIRLSGMALRLTWTGSVIRLAHGAAGIWDGEITVEAGRYDLSSGEGEATLLFRGIDAGEVVRLGLPPESLSVKARLQGAVGIRLERGGWSLPPTELAAEGPGVIRLRHPAMRTWAQNAGIPDVLPRALEEFYFQTLRFDLERTRQGEIRSRARLAGHNPQLYDGHPVEVNLDLSGPLDEILQQFLEMRRLVSDR